MYKPSKIMNVQMTLNIRHANVIASTLLTAFIYFFYAHSVYFVNFFGKKQSIHFFSLQFSFNSWQILTPFFFLYVFAFTLIYLFESAPETSKSINCIRGIISLCKSPTRVFFEGLPKEEKVALLTVLVKAFFAPLMLHFFMEQSTEILNNLANTITHLQTTSDFFTFFRQDLFLLCFHAILLFDLTFFVVGYLIEHKSLGNKIISVEPTLLGWGVALFCYPPFNLASPCWVASDFPFFANPILFVLINILLLILFAIYAWGSFALGLKASNLTHRGIIDTGPYRYIRHPAYFFKNLAWWLGTIPAIMEAIPKGIIAVLAVVICMGSWSVLYFLRALTEERHLRMVNADYDDYMKKVPYRFIPGIY